MTLVIAAVWLTACGIGAATPGPDDPVNSLTPMPAERPSSKRQSCS
jgi:hypothetical protein